MTPPLTQESARSLVDAGYMPLSEYIELCKRNGWKADMTDPTGNALRAHDMTQGSAVTERPWRVTDNGGIVNRAGLAPARLVANCGHSELGRANAALIVTAVNERDQLLSDKAALEAENARLREALEQISAVCTDNLNAPNARCDMALGFVRQVAVAALARSALKGA